MRLMYDRISVVQSLLHFKTRTPSGGNWNASCEPMLIMLILAAVIASGVNIARACSGGEANFLECLGIFAAIFLSVVITVVMEGRSAKAFEALNKINEDTKV